MQLTTEHILSFLERNYTILNDDDMYAYDKLKQIVAKRMEVTVEEIDSNTRKGEIILARHIYHTLCKYVLRMSLSAIGVTTRRDHATVLNSIRRVHGWYQTDLAFRKLVNRFLDDMGWEYVKDKLLETRITR